jgi:hypothetical protein
MRRCPFEILPLHRKEDMNTIPVFVCRFFANRTSFSTLNHSSFRLHSFVRVRLIILENMLNLNKVP